MKKVLVDFNKSLNAEHCSKWKQFKNMLTDITWAYDDMKLPPMETIAEVNRLVNDTDSFVFDKQTGSGAVIRGAHGEHLPVDTAVAQKLFQKPAGYAVLKSKVDALIAFYERKKSSHNVADLRMPMTSIVKDFVFDGVELTYSKSRAESIEEAGKAYVETEQGAAVYSLLQAISKSFADNKEGWKPLISSIVSEGKLREERFSELLHRSLSSIDVNSGEIVVKVSDGLKPRFWGDQRG